MLELEFCVETTSKCFLEGLVSLIEVHIDLPFSLLKLLIPLGM